MNVASLILGIAIGGFAAWAPAHAANAPAPDPAKVQFRWNVRVPMRDGVQLSAIAYARRDQQQPAPCVFTPTPYGAQSYHDRGVYFAANGYPFLAIDVRGYWEKNHNSGRAVASETLQDARTVNVTLYHDRAHPSALYIPTGPPDTSKQAFIDWSKPRAIALQTVAGDRVAKVIGAARMVSLGEPAHGAHEPLAFRNRLFRSLVEKQGFTAIALETGFNEARLVNDFVLGGAGDPREIARAGLTWGFGSFVENIELLRWLREYNAERVRDRKVKFYGIDLSGGDSKGTFATSDVAIEDVLSYLTRADAKLAASARDAVGAFVDRFTLDKYHSLSGNERRDLQTGIEDVIALFSAERRHLIAASSEGEYEWALRSAIVAKQLETLFRLAPADVPDGGVVAEFHQAAAARDAAMADNALWALRREGPAGRVLVFAHNAHIMNAPLRGGVWSVYPEPPAAMGQHLRSALGKELLIIGTSSSANGHGLPAAPAEATSVDAALAGLGLSNFMLDLRDAPHASIPWLQRAQSLRANFTTQIDIPLPEAFDAIVYFDELNATGGE